MPDTYLCVQEGCGKNVTATKNQRYRSHKKPDGEPCEMSSAEIPPRETEAGPIAKGADPGVPEEGRDYATCPHCRRSVKLTRLRYFGPHDTTLYGGERCPLSGVRYSLTKRTEDVPLPGDTVPQKGVYLAQTPRVTNQAEVEEAKMSGPRLALPPGSTVSRPKPASGPEGEGGPSSSSASPSNGTTSPAPTLTSAPAASSPTEPRRTSGPTIDLSGISPADINLARQSMEEPPPNDPDNEWKAYMADSVLPAPGAASTPSTSTLATSSEPSIQWTEVSDSFLVESVHHMLTTAAFPPEAPAAAKGFDDLLFTAPPPSRYPPKPKGPAQPMTAEAEILATQIKETFYAYSNRKTKDNRGAQTTLGPSEIGTPCDRRLAMALMGVPAVNPGGDDWASFVGTWTHAGMAEVYTFANAGTGRYAVEMRLSLSVPSVPGGTTDLLDRRTKTVLDWKIMGDYSLRKFKAEGPSTTYRTQGHVYGLGAELAGEEVERVAIVGMPRGGSSLNGMHVWIEPYNRQLAQDALDRVERIAGQVQEIRRPDGLGDTPGQMSTAQTFDTGDDCKFCPFFLSGDKKMKKGCPGS